MNWRTAKSLLVLLEQINKKYPGRNKASDGTIADKAHASRVSDHNPDANGRVNAMDITYDPLRGPDLNLLADRLTKDARPSYVIYNRRIWNAGAGWSKYTGADPHTNHLHVSVKPSNADIANPWRLEEEDMKLSNAAEVNLIWQANGVNRAPTEKEVKEAMGRTLENYMEYFLQLPFVKANLAKVRFYDKDLEKFNEINKILKG